MTKEVTTDLLLKANDYAFDVIKKNFVAEIGKEPMTMPLLVSALGHDWVFKNHNHPEDAFKAALFEYKIIEDPNIGAKLEKQQMELMIYLQTQLGGGALPGMGMGMGGPGLPAAGMPGGPPLGGMF